MKKLLILFISVIIIGLFLCSCSSGDGTTSGGGAGQDIIQDEGQDDMQDDAQGNRQESGQETGQNSGDGQDSPENVSENNNSENGVLQLIGSSHDSSDCTTENGYYYLTEETVELKDGNYGSHLMYMDFAAGREIYLCSTAGCKHDSADCPAVFLYDDFPTVSSRLFVFQDNLYILSREYDDDGSVSQVIGDDYAVEKKPAALYRAGLDGTERQKVYTFDPDLTLEDIIMENDSGIYVITKKLSADKDGNQTYTTSSERKLMFLDLQSFTIKEICPMTFDDNFSWHAIGCCRYGLVMCGTDFGRELSRDERWNDDDAYRELYLNSFEVYALLDINSGEMKELCRQANRNDNSVKIIGDSLYISSDENQDIEEINMKTGQKKKLCSLPQNLIMDVLGDTLCCRDWDLTKDHKWYFVNTKTGGITHSELVNKCNGWSLDFQGETSSDVLFIYDYDAETTDNETYDIHQYKYALISKEDLFAGRNNYRKIEMIGPGLSY